MRRFQHLIPTSFVLVLSTLSSTALAGNKPGTANPPPKAPAKAAAKAPPKAGKAQAKTAAVDTGLGHEEALQIHVITKSGGRFTGLVSKSSSLAQLFGGERKLDGSKIPADLDVRLQHVNGLAGSMGLRGSEIDHVEVEGSLEPAKVDEVESKIHGSKAELWAKEKERLAKVDASRASAAKAEADAIAAAEAAAKGPKKLPPDLQQWIDKYPPGEGWLPAKKQEIYHQTIILNNRAPTDEERAWMDDYDQWKVAYDAWLKLELEKSAAEDKAKAEGQPAPTGSDKPEPSKTSAAPAAGIDPDHPTTADAAKLPPPIDPKVAKPVAIGKDVKKPSDVSKDVDKPAKLPNGTEP